MKKTYIEPECQIMVLKVNAPLLIISGGDSDSVNVTYSDDGYDSTQGDTF